MNRLLIFAIAGMLVVSGCSGNNAPAPASNSPHSDISGDSIVQMSGNFDAQRFLGEYIGGIGQHTIILSLNYINGRNASGYNIVKGNRRNIKGTVAAEGNVYRFMLHEPGSDPNDGYFDFIIDTATMIAEGIFVPNSKLPDKKIRLEKRVAQEASDTYAGSWYLGGLKLEMKKDGSGRATGTWYDAAKDQESDADLKFSWIVVDEGVRIEWEKNPYFKNQVMVFRDETEDGGEGVLRNGEQEMYRYAF